MQYNTSPCSQSPSGHTPSLIRVTMFFSTSFSSTTRLIFELSQQIVRCNNSSNVCGKHEVTVVHSSNKINQGLHNHIVNTRKGLSPVFSGHITVEQHIITDMAENSPVLWLSSFMIQTYIWGLVKKKKKTTKYFRANLRANFFLGYLLNAMETHLWKSREENKRPTWKGTGRVCPRTGSNAGADGKKNYSLTSI